MKRRSTSAQLARFKIYKESGAGYTITEVLIVLAVTTTIFIAVAAAFSGRQDKAQFNQSVRNFESSLQTIISEVANGNYKSGNVCTVTSGTPALTGTVAQPGTNTSCIFLGKVVVGRQNTYDVITVLGRRLNSSNKPVVDLSEASPTAIISPTNSPVDLTVIYGLSYGLTIRKIYSLSSGGANNASYGSFALLYELSGGAGNSGTGSGSRGIMLYGVNGNTSPVDIGTTPTVNASNLVPLPYGLRICLLSGTNPATDTRAELTIGANQTQSTISVLLDTGTSGACGNV
jgi:type II secretory pathway pseudopilin PulG